MKCPRCEFSLFERDRDGVTMEACDKCRGAWLDRGELEKLISRTDRESEEQDSRETRGREERRRDGRMPFLCSLHGLPNAENVKQKPRPSAG